MSSVCRELGWAGLGLAQADVGCTDVSTLPPLPDDDMFDWSPSPGASLDDGARHIFFPAHHLHAYAMARHRAGPYAARATNRRALSL